MGAARPASGGALVGARRPAVGLDRRYAADRGRRRAKLARCLDRAAARRCGGGGRRGRRRVLVGRMRPRHRHGFARHSPRPVCGRWLAGELLANTAWAGTLVYSGALFVESYGASTEATGAVLAIGAGAYVAGNITLRRRADRESRRLLVGLALALALTTALFGALRPSVAVSTVLFSAAAAVAGGRTFVSSAYGLAAAAELRPAAMAMRAASMQFGYFAGSFAAGTALAVGGYAAFGAAIAVLFVGAAIALVALSPEPAPGSLPPDPRPAASGAPCVQPDSVLASGRRGVPAARSARGDPEPRRCPLCRQAASAAGGAVAQREPHRFPRADHRRLWGEDVPESAQKMVQIHVSQLRKALPEPRCARARPAT